MKKLVHSLPIVKSALESDSKSVWGVPNRTDSYWLHFVCKILPFKISLSEVLIFSVLFLKSELQYLPNALRWIKLKFGLKGFGAWRGQSSFQENNLTTWIWSRGHVGSERVLLNPSVHFPPFRSDWSVPCYSLALLLEFQPSSCVSF